MNAAPPAAASSEPQSPPPSGGSPADPGTTTHRPAADVRVRLAHLAAFALTTMALFPLLIGREWYVQTLMLCIVSRLFLPEH